MTRVYIVHDSGHDYLKAAEFGGIVFCTNTYINQWDLHEMHRQLSITMVDAEEDDYVVVSSLTSLCSIAVGIMAAKFKRVNLLLFQSGHYAPEAIDFSVDVEPQFTTQIMEDGHEH